MNRIHVGAGWLACGLFAIAAVFQAADGHGWRAMVLSTAAGIWCGRLLMERQAATAARATPPAADPHRDQLEAVLAGVSEGVLIVDRAGVVLAASPVATALLRTSISDGTTLRLNQVLPWPQLDQAIQRCLGTGEPQRFEGVFGSAPELTLGVHVCPFRRVAATAGVVVVLDDQSRLRQLESHRRDFVANVSHELKTPLAAIQGFVETLIDDPDVPAPTRQRFLQRVQVQVGRLTTLVSDLLTLSRLDEHVPEPAEPCDFGTVVREVVRDLLPLSERQGVRLSCDLPGDAVWVAAERETLRQVVSNLVDNAIKYTPAGGAVSVRLQPQGLRAELAVVDTGIGLSTADQERVFERFYRVDKARSHELGGTGLGLSIVKNTVQSLGGEVGVQSALGRGSRFWVRVPVVPVG